MVANSAKASVAVLRDYSIRIVENTHVTYVILLSIFRLIFRVNTNIKYISAVPKSRADQTSILSVSRVKTVDKINIIKTKCQKIYGKWLVRSSNPAGNYMFKVNNRNTRTRCEICSKLTIKIPERRQWRWRWRCYNWEWWLYWCNCFEVCIKSVLFF